MKKGEKMSEEQKEKIRVSNLGKNLGKKYGPPSDETKRKISASNKGHKVSEETRAKISEKLTGRPGREHTSETKARISAAKMGHEVSAEAREKIRQSILGTKQSLERRENTSRAMAKVVVDNGHHPKVSGYKHGWHDSPKAGRVWYRSSLEKYWYQQFDTDDRIERYYTEPFSIPYVNQKGLKRNYIPDVLLETTVAGKVVVEIKPAKLVAEPNNQLKFSAARQTLALLGGVFMVLTESDA